MTTAIEQAVSKDVAQLVDDRLRACLMEAHELLIQAWRGRIWEPLGYPDWTDYAASLGELLTVRLPASLRRIAEARWRVAASLVRRQADRGLTCLELELETGWGHGAASAALHAAESKGAVRRVAVFRQGYAAYVTGGTPGSLSVS